MTRSARVADEDRQVAQPRVARDLLDHLGVVVGGQRGLGRAAVGHRHPADEVGQPGERAALELGVLVQEVVEVPALVGDHQVERLLGDQVVEDHEVGQQDLVHPPVGLEDVQVVLARLGRDVRALVRQESRRRVYPLAALGEQLGDRVLGQPVDLQVRLQRPQLVGDRDVAPDVAEPDRRGDVERAAAAVQRPGPRPRPLRRPGARESRNSWIEQVAPHRIAEGRQVAAALEGDQPDAEQLGQGDPVRVRDDAVAGRRAPPAPGNAPRGRSPRSPPWTSPARASTVRASTSGVVSSPQPIASSIGLVRCGSVTAACMKKSTNSGYPAQPVLVAVGLTVPAAATS